jgi:hypothetical protein
VKNGGIAATDFAKAMSVKKERKERKKMNFRRATYLAVSVMENLCFFAIFAIFCGYSIPSFLAVPDIRAY